MNCILQGQIKGANKELSNLSNYQKALKNIGGRPRKNLLINWCFTENPFPINNKAQKVYDTGVSQGYDLDCWWSIFTNINLNNNLLLSQSTSQQYGGAFRQVIQNPKDLIGKVITVSILCNNVIGTPTAGIFKSNGINSELNSIFSNNISEGLTSFSFTAPQDIGSENYPLLLFSVSIPMGASIQIKAMKMEIGDTQTLAYQDKNNEWQLFDTPDYSTEYIKCASYSETENKRDIKYGLGIRPNKNLLDNWYFVGGGSQQGGGQFPINQRGKTSYTRGGYGIDRWLFDSGSTAIISADGVEISTDLDNRSAMYQRISKNSLIKGQTYTASFLVKNISGQVRCYVNSASSSVNISGSFVTSGVAVLSVTFLVPDDFDDEFINVIFRITSAGGGTVIAAKLELGDHQTLAYQDEEGNWQLFETPDYGEELAKCQRYQIALDGIVTIAGRTYVNVETSVLCFLPTPVTMWINPTWVGDIENIVVYSNGSTYTATSIMNVNKTSNGIVFTVTIPSGVGVKQPIIANLQPGGIFDANL